MPDLEKKVETSTEYTYRKVTEYLANTPPPKIVIHGGGAEKLQAWCERIDEQIQPYTQKIIHLGKNTIGYVGKKIRTFKKKLY